MKELIVLFFNLPHIRSDIFTGSPFFISNIKV